MELLQMQLQTIAPPRNKNRLNALLNRLATDYSTAIADMPTYMVSATMAIYQSGGRRVFHLSSDYLYCCGSSDKTGEVLLQAKELVEEVRGDTDDTVSITFLLIEFPEGDATVAPKSFTVCAWVRVDNEDCNMWPVGHAA